MPPLDDAVNRYRAHNDAIERKHRNQSAPPGKTCAEPGCTRGAFPWDDRCPPCEKKHRKALRAANSCTSEPLEPISPYAFEHKVLLANGSRR
jgi:hypothetical protein